jgi:acetyl-CoA C-acetyltransferase
VTGEDRVPVVVASGQALERDAAGTALDLAQLASAAALDEVPRLRGAVERVSVVGILSPCGPAPARALSARLGLRPSATETTTIGGNTPQALVSRAASDIAAGRLSATLIAGAEAMRSARAGHRRPPADSLDGEPDPVVGDDRLGVGPAETAIGLLLPVHLYAMFERASRSELGRLLAPFTAVAAAHPCAWFPEDRTAEAIATPSPDNRLVAEPYTKRMAAFLDVDQGAAVVVCSLAAARAAGVADRAVFVWSGASCNDVWEPVARPAPADSPAIAVAAGAALGASGVGIDDVDVLDLYSCFPSAVQAACRAIGVAGDDARGLTVTGGLPYFGGPGNNYSTHAIATATDRLRAAGGLALVGALGWYTTKHAYGLYGSGPPPRGFRSPDTTAEQAAIDATALPVALEVDGGAEGTVVAGTVVHGPESVTAAPVFVALDDGRRVAASARDRDLAALAALAGTPLVGRRVRVAGSPPAWEVQ